MSTTPGRTPVASTTTVGPARPIRPSVRGDRVRPRRRVAGVPSGTPRAGAPRRGRSRHRQPGRVAPLARVEAEDHRRPGRRAGRSRRARSAAVDRGAAPPRHLARRLPHAQRRRQHQRVVRLPPRRLERVARPGRRRPEPEALQRLREPRRQRQRAGASGTCPAAPRAAARRPARAGARVATPRPVDALGRPAGDRDHDRQRAGRAGRPGCVPEHRRCRATQRHAARALLAAGRAPRTGRPPAPPASGRLAPPGTCSRWRSCSSSVGVPGPWP